MDGKIPHIIEYKRKRHSSATIRNGVVILRIPQHLPKNIQEEHIHTLLEKISTKHKQQDTPQGLIPPLFQGDIITPWDGLPLSLFKKEDSTSDLRSIITKKHRASTEKTMLSRHIIPWARDNWTGPINTLIYAWKERMNISRHTTSVCIKHLHSKWGMCSSQGEITLALKTLFLPYHLFEYVLVHELAHLVHMNHSPAFWSTIEKVLPHYKALRQELKRYG